MSQIVEQLTKVAGQEKRAYYDYVKAFSSAGIAALVRGGVEFEKAANLTKSACETDVRIKQLADSVQIFEKTASYVSELEAKVEQLEKIAGKVEEAERIEHSEPLSKLAAVGFTPEELEHMSHLPENLIEKVASQGSQPWEMGAGVGFQREKTDALLEFILG